MHWTFVSFPVYAASLVFLAEAFHSKRASLLADIALDIALSFCNLLVFAVCFSSGMPIYKVHIALAGLMLPIGAFAAYSVFGRCRWHSMRSSASGHRPASGKSGSLDSIGQAAAIGNKSSVEVKWDILKEADSRELRHHQIGGCSPILDHFAHELRIAALFQHRLPDEEAHEDVKNLDAREPIAGTSSDVIILTV